MREPKKWTIMFYFASDNPLAPGVVSQLKALSNAGFHQDVNVVAQFDPQIEGTQTHVFEVNLVNKLIQKQTEPRNKFKFWGKNDPYIRNLVFDKLWRKSDKDRDGKNLRELIETVLNQRDNNRETGRPSDARRNGLEKITYAPPDPFDPGDRAFLREDKSVDTNVGNGWTEPGPNRSLDQFLRFCAKSYPAEHYMLLLVGHGLIVGNDMFLLDEHGAESSLSLKKLGAVLKRFKKANGGYKLDLLGFHSCSMSSLEVAYELRETVDYMLSSQGTEFLGTWPYREMLIRIFNDVIETDEAEKDASKNAPTIQSSIERIFTYILRNSFDFQLAGYSFDLCLTDLNQVDTIKAPLKTLSGLLKYHLLIETPLVKEAILLAHCDAQSFWQDHYTDLYDFCACLIRRCKALGKSCKEATTHMDPIITACENVVVVLSKKKQAYNGRNYATPENRLIVKSEFAGPQYQYAHGLSVYFPWSQADDFFWSMEYPTYAFEETGWREFLLAYFDRTERAPVWREIRTEQGMGAVVKQELDEKLLEQITNKVFNFEGPLNRFARPGKVGLGGGKGTPDGGLDPEKGSPDSGLDGEKGSPDSGLDGEKGSPDSGLAAGKGTADSGLGGGKGTPDGGMGGCACPSLKNYPSFTRDPSDERNPPEKTPNLASKGLLVSLIHPTDE